MPHQGSWAAAEVAEATEAYLHPVVVARGVGPADGALPSVEGLSLLGAGVELVSLRRRTDADTAVEVRVVNMSDQPTVAVLGSDAVPVHEAALVDGLGTVGSQSSTWPMVGSGFRCARGRSPQCALDIGAPLHP